MKATIYLILSLHVSAHDGAQDQENAPMSPDPFPHERLGSGNETTWNTVYCCTNIVCITSEGMQTKARVNYHGI